MPRHAGGRPPLRGLSELSPAPARATFWLACAVLGGLVVSAACTNDGAVLIGEVLGIADSEVSLSKDIQPVFNARCAIPTCHVGQFPEESLSLEAGRLYDPIVGAVEVRSLQVPSLKRIMAGDAENSYLVHKIQGTHFGVGGFGGTMPLNDQPLDPATIQAIRTWIDQGAIDN